MTKKDNDVKMAVMAEKLDNIEKDISQIKKTLNELPERLDKHYVSLDRFKPVERLVFGAAGIILTIVIGAIVYGVVIINQGM